MYLSKIKMPYKPGGRAVSGLQLFSCWDYGFESRRGMAASCECCVLSGRSLCGLIPRPGGVLPSVVTLYTYNK
jgi:hypothetical protein